MINTFVTYVVPVIHVAACLFLIVVVLLQTGKGADMGAVFGGGSQTLFGASGAGNLLTKLTTGTAITFMITSLILSYAQAPSSSGLLDRLRGAETPPPVTAPPETPPAPEPEAQAPQPGDTVAGDTQAAPEPTAPDAAKPVQPAAAPTENPPATP